MFTAVRNDTEFLDFVHSLDEEDITCMQFDAISPEEALKALDFFMFKKDGETVGFFGYGSAHGLDDPDTIIAPPFISKRYRRKGYGKELLGIIEDKARRESKQAILQMISPNNEKMLKLSVSCGFLPHDQDEDYITFLKYIGG